MALQRLRGSRRSPGAAFAMPSPLVDFAPRSKGSNPVARDGHRFRPSRSAFRRPSSSSATELLETRVRSSGPSCVVRSSRGPPSRPRAVVAPRPGPAAGDGDEASSPELPCPAARSRISDPHIGRRSAAPPRTTSRVWPPASRLSPPTLPAREAPERPRASPFKAFPSTRCASLSGPRPSWRSPPLARGRVFRASTSGRVRSAPVSRGSPAVDAFLGFVPFRAFPPLARAPAFARGRPSRPRAVRRLVTPGPQGFAYRADRLGPSPGCRLSWGFAPSDRRSAPFTSREAGGFASRRRMRSRARPALLASSTARNHGIGSAARRHRPSVLGSLPSAHRRSSVRERLPDPLARSVPEPPWGSCGAAGSTCAAVRRRCWAFPTSSPGPMEASGRDPRSRRGTGVRRRVDPVHVSGERRGATFAATSPPVQEWSPA
jgi:hypothetical protein